MQSLFKTLGISAILMGTAQGPALAGEPLHSARPVARPLLVSEVAPRPRPGTEAAPRSANDQAFQGWIARFRPVALAKGISPHVFDEAFRHVHLNRTVLHRAANQSEFVQPIWVYLDHTVSSTRIKDGKRARRHYRHLLNAIQARYGVDQKIVVAIWGMESAYGAHRGSIPLVEALATLAYSGMRTRFFEIQLIDALKIIQDGDVTPAKMTGSWAGAMGHTQFMPSSYLQDAVDFSGDGKRDIWSNDPTDALASTAAYLKRAGWQTGKPWGVEVRLPPGFDYSQTGRRVSHDAATWARMGVRRAGGGRLPSSAGPGQILLPAGARGAAFLVFHNFHVILRYNAADAYALAVGRLADRIGGAGPLVGHWPRGEEVLDKAQRVELQDKLTAAGFDTKGADGMIGPNTIAAVRAFQRSVGMVPDGYASPAVLRRLMR